MRKRFSLIELLLSIAVIFILLGMSVKLMSISIKRAKIVRAITEIRNIQTAIEAYQDEHRKEVPDRFEALNINTVYDPWKTAYHYQNYKQIPKGQRRKDKNMNPLNSDYDLWSNGPDGKTAYQVNSAFGHDDIIRAADGQFIGVADDY